MLQGRFSSVESGVLARTNLQPQSHSLEKSHALYSAKQESGPKSAFLQIHHMAMRRRR